jgi:hypothetical protein
MKPMNFPGRKNQRRIDALARMKPPSSGAGHYERSIHPYSLLKAKIIPESIARGIRTKKDRRDRAKLSRNAS